MDTKTLAKYLYFIGALVAVVAALFKFSAEWLSIVLAVIAIFVGMHRPPVPRQDKADRFDDIWLILDQKDTFAHLTASLMRKRPSPAVVSNIACSISTVKATLHS